MSREQAESPPLGTSTRARDALPPLLFSNVIGGAAGGVFFLAGTWSFELAEMGLYSVAIGLQWMLAGFLGSGVSTAVIRLAGERYLARDRTGLSHIVVWSVLLAGTGSVVGVALSLVLPTVLWMGGLPLTAQQMALVCAWAGARAVLDCVRAGLLAQGLYRLASGIVLLSAVTGLAALGIVLERADLTLDLLLLAHVAGLTSACLLVAGLVAGFWFPRPFRLDLRELRALLRYAPFPILSEGTRLLLANLGPLLVLGWAGAVEAGLYGVGRYPAYVFDIVAVSLFQFWLPEAVRRLGSQPLASFLSGQLRLAGVVGAAMLVAALLSRPFFPLLGESFALAAWLFVLSSFDFAVGLLFRPVESAYHGLRRPHLELAARLIHLPVVLLLAWMLVPSSGASGMLVAQILAGSLLLFIGLLLLRTAAERAPSPPLAG